MSRPLSVVLAGLLVAATTTVIRAAPSHAQLTDDVGGTTSAPSGTLRNGCRRYSFTYAVQVPTEDWTLEVSIVDRRGHGVASFAFLGPADEKTQTPVYRLCRASTVPGRFRIRAQLSWYDDPSTPHPVPVPVTRFRLARP
jgi:hypothetical protein